MTQTASNEPRLKTVYTQQILPELMKTFKFTSVMRAPRIEKIVVNMGVGEATQDKKAIEPAVKDLTAITGQKPLVTRAKRSIAQFKLREGMIVGCKVTLRGRRMWEFFDRFMNIALPRVRDFQGLSATGFDGRGNYNVGISEQIIFPEINYDDIDKVRGMDICMVTSAQKDEEAREMLKLMGFPFRKKRS